MKSDDTIIVPVFGLGLILGAVSTMTFPLIVSVLAGCVLVAAYVAVVVKTSRRRTA